MPTPFFPNLQRRIPELEPELPEELDLSDIPDDTNLDLSDIPDDSQLDLSDIPDVVTDMDIPEPESIQLAPAQMNITPPESELIDDSESVIAPRGLWERFRSPLTDIGRRITEPIGTVPNPDAPYLDPEGQALAGMGEGVAKFGGAALDELSAPINLAPALLSGGSTFAAKFGLGALSKLAGTGSRIASLPTAVSGGQRMLEAETPTDFGLGALEAAGGFFGMRGPKKAPIARVTDEINPLTGQGDLVISGDIKLPEPDFKTINARMQELFDKGTAGTLTGDELAEAQRLNKQWRAHPEFNKPVTTSTAPEIPDYSPTSEATARKILADKGIQVSGGMSNKQIIDNARAITKANNPIDDVIKTTPEIVKKDAPKIKVKSLGKGEFIHEGYPDYVLDKDGNITRTLSGNPVRAHKELERNLALEILNTPRAINASMDMSFPLRQGITLIHKPGWWKAWGDMAKSFGSEKAFKGTMDSILEKPNYKPNIAYKKMNPANGKVEPTSFADWAGLSITNDTTLRELEHMRSLAERVPGFKQIVHSSNRGYTAFANKLRSDTFDSLVNDFTKAGMDPRKDRKLAESIAGFVNAASGRGSAGSMEKYMEALNIGFFSPRLQLSRAQMLGRGARALVDPNVYQMTTPNVRKEYAKSMATLAGIWGTLATTASMAGADVSLDPTNPDYMKIKIGNTRLDPGAGFQQYIVLTNKLLQQKATSSTTGKTKYFKDAKSKYDPTMGGEIGKFLYSKSAPLTRMAVDLGFATQNEPFDLTDQMTRSISPIMIQDLMEVLSNEGIAPEMLGNIPEFFGMGAQTYGEGIDYRRRMLGPNFGKSLAFPQKATRVFR